MKLKDLEIFIIANPPPQRGGRYFIIVKLVTDNGITGFGEVYNASFMPQTMKLMIEDVFRHHFLGADPFAIEALWRQVYGRGYSARPDISLMSVLSGLETALWDIKGKALEKPVYDLLGGMVRPRLRCYSYLYPPTGGTYDNPAIYSNPDIAAEVAASYVKQGFTAVKFDPAGDYGCFDPRQPSLQAIALSAEFCRKIRDAVGDKADILFGTHGQFTTSGAIRLAAAIEPYQPLWFEEPVPPEMPEQMARVANATTIPIATGERLTTKYEFARVLQLGAANIIQFAIGRVGGLWEAKKIAAMAETHYAQIAPHLYCGPVEAAANLHLAASCPNFLIQETIDDVSGFHGDLIGKKIAQEAGFLRPPATPGLGIEFNEQLARKHAYNGDELHLLPANQPVDDAEWD